MTDFPDDIEQLKAMLIAKDALLQAKEEEVAALKTQVQLLVEQLNLSKSKRFASQSEKVAKGTFTKPSSKMPCPLRPRREAKRDVSHCLLILSARCKLTYMVSPCFASQYQNRRAG